MIIAVDGPAGAGKSTVARKLSKALGFLYLDTGALYRALTLKAIERKLDPTDQARLIEMTRDTSIDIKNNPDGSIKIFLDGQDVTALIRQPRITKLVSDIAKIAGVREVMLDLQRKIGRQNNSVLDGRDIGTVVFPQAEKKFYIDADFKERCLRRFKELKELGEDVSLAEVENDLSNRDTIDSSRKTAPLKKADDAIYVDTTKMTVEEVLDTLLDYIGTRGYKDTRLQGHKE